MKKQELFKQNGEPRKYYILLSNGRVIRPCAMEVIDEGVGFIEFLGKDGEVFLRVWWDEIAAIGRDDYRFKTENGFTCECSVLNEKTGEFEKVM